MRQIMTDEERLEKIAVKAFKQHWAKIVRDLEKGKNTHANKRYGCFEADTSVRQKILANRVYGLDHARKMVALSERAIKRNLSCYLEKAVEYNLCENKYEPGEQEAFMRKLVSSEYVIFDSHPKNYFDDYDEDDGDLVVAEYPAEVAYDDWYERSIGSSLYSCSAHTLMKSTGEAFSKTEVDWLKGSIQHNIDGNEFDAFWWFECELLDKNKLWIRIHEFVVKEQYVEEFLREAEALSKNQLQEFVRQVLEYLYKEAEEKEEKEKKKIKKKLTVFNNYESMEEQDLFAIIENFLFKNWEAEILSDYDIRIAENIMNRITGRKDRDYHT
jgi:hypothetical protein